MPYKKKKFTTKQIRDFAAREERVELFKKELSEYLDEVNVHYEDTAEATSSYIAKYSKFIEQHEHKQYTNHGRTKMLKENLKLFMSLKNEMEGLRSIYSTIAEIRRTREEIALNLDVNKPQLMDLLYHGGKHLPLWIGELGESPSSRTGRLTENSLPEPGELVAAYVKDMWILAEVKAVDADEHVTVRDVDDDTEGFVRLPRDQLLLLPLYRVDPKRHPYAIFEQSSVVLALYPQTTCFYKGIVESPPHSPDDSYLITFEDEEYENGHPPAVNVSQRFVLNYREKPLEVKSVCVELSDSSETDEETPEPVPPPMPVRRKFKVRDSDDVEPNTNNIERQSSNEIYETDIEDEEVEELSVEDASEFEGDRSTGGEDEEEQKEGSVEDSDVDIEGSQSSEKSDLNDNCSNEPDNMSSENSGLNEDADRNMFDDHFQEEYDSS